MRTFLLAMAKDFKKKVRRRKDVRLAHDSKTKKVKVQNTPKNNEISFDFSYTDWLRTVKLGEFTNMLKNPSEFAELIYTIMNKMIPYITENWHWIEKNVYPGSNHNCHPVTREKIDLVKDIINQTHSVDLEPIIEGAEKKTLWQLGHQGAVRIIVYYMASSKTFYPLFVDYHHLIHPVPGDRRSQVKHNDYNSKKWCPVNEYD